ncbi:MAG: anthranilate synthase component I [Spirochaetes bacterium]|nr:anthranilate synthase component I [Spirochaetota bacterium]
MLRPSLKDFLQMAKPGHIVPVIMEVPSDRITPVDAYYAVSASYLLESAEKGLHLGRYSFLGVDPCAVIEVRGTKCRITEDGKTRELAAVDPLRAVKDFLAARPFSGEGDLSPFPGGAVGYIGYEAVSRFESVKLDESKPGLDIPDACFMVTRYTLVFDNLMHTLKIIYNVNAGKDPESDYADAVMMLTQMSDRISAGAPGPVDTPVIGDNIRQVTSKNEFVSSVNKIREYIIAGDAIQVVLSQQMEVDFKGDPFCVYRSLRSINPSPYMFFLNMQGFTLLGASPEVMVKVDKNRAMLRPIAGTRRRGINVEEDEALQRELLADNKERAEHIMLVDLARNDLGRIAKPGTVKVERFMEVEMYSHVMHIVSEVSAQCREDSDPVDVIRAVFPAGTVSGAPKVRAMEIIDELERVKRNHYAGLVGYFSYNGNFDSCITIRSAAVKNDKMYLQSGAGIVYDSDPDKEYQETMSKIEALVEALKNGRN